MVFLFYPRECIDVCSDPFKDKVRLISFSFGSQKGPPGSDGYNAAYYYWLARLYHGAGRMAAEAAALKRGLDASPKSPHLRLQQRQQQQQYARLVDLLLRRRQAPRGPPP